MKTVDVGKSHLCDPLCMCHFFDPGGTGSAERECLCPRWSLLQILLWNYCCQSEAGAQEPFNHPHHPRLKVQTYCWLKRSQFTPGLWAVSPTRKFWHTVSRLRGICFVSRVCVCADRHQACTSMINAAINTLVHGPLRWMLLFLWNRSQEWDC